MKRSAPYGESQELRRSRRIARRTNDNANCDIDSDSITSVSIPILECDQPMPSRNAILPILVRFLDKGKHGSDLARDGISAEGSFKKFRMKGGWCLLDGLAHVSSAHDGILLPVIERHGPPPFYFSVDRDASAENAGSGYESGVPKISAKGSTFRSLCRIVSGQQLAVSAARAVYSRLLGAFGSSPEDPSRLTPAAVLEIADAGADAVETRLKKPAGLSGAKARSIIDLARHFQSGNLSDDILLKSCSDVEHDDMVRSRLLSVKGIGPWSVDMFLIFDAHRPDILPLGDLGVRKGTSCLFGVKGSGKNRSLCEKKDARLLRSLHQPFEPFRSLSSYYMWKCADTTAFNDSTPKGKDA